MSTSDTVSTSDTATSAVTASGRHRQSPGTSTALLTASFVLVCLIWGTTWIAIKLAVTDMPPLTASGLRFVLAAPVFIGACRSMRIPMTYPRHLRWFFFYMSACYFGIPFFLYNYGEQHISSGLTAICFSSVSVLMVVFAVPLLGSRISPLQFFAVLVAFSALGLLIVHSQGIAVASGWGVVAVLVAASMHALSYTLMKKHASGIHSLTINTLPMALAGVVLVGLGLVFERPGADAFTTRSVLATIYLGVIASVIGFAVYFWLVQHMDTVTASFVFVLFPIVAQFFGVVVEGTRFSGLDVLLTAVILVAFGVTQWGERRRRNQLGTDPVPPVVTAATPPDPTGVLPTRALVDGIPAVRTLEEIYRHAVASYPAECCGFVRDDSMTRCLNAMDQLSARRPQDFDRSVRTGYAFGLPDLRDLAESFDSPSPVRLVYHSHPDVGAYFSDEDARNAVVDGQPVYPVRHLVVDAAADGVRGSRLYEFSPAAGRYEELRSFGHPRGRTAAPASAAPAGPSRSPVRVEARESS